MNQPTTAQRCHSETEKLILKYLFSSALSQFKKYHLSGNLKFIDLGVFLSLKMSTVEIAYNEHQDQAEFARYNRFSL